MLLIDVKKTFDHVSSNYLLCTMECVVDRVIHVGQDHRPGYRPALVPRGRVEDKSPAEITYVTHSVCHPPEWSIQAGGKRVGRMHDNVICRQLKVVGVTALGGD